MTYKKKLREHVKIRAWERFGKHFSGKDCDQVIRDIKEKKAKFIARLSFVTSVWKVMVKDIDIIVVYDSKIECPLTVLTEKLWEERNFKVYTEQGVNEPLKSTNPKIIEELKKLRGNNHG